MLKQNGNESWAVYSMDQIMQVDIIGLQSSYVYNVLNLDLSLHYRLCKFEQINGSSMQQIFNGKSRHKLGGCAP